MGTVMALGISMGKSYKAVYNGPACLSEGEILHNQAGFQVLLEEASSCRLVIRSLTDAFAPAGVYVYFRS